MELIKIVLCMAIYCLFGFYNCMLLKYKTNHYRNFNIIDKIICFLGWPVIWIVIMILVIGALIKTLYEERKNK